MLYRAINLSESRDTDPTIRRRMIIRSPLILPAVGVEERRSRGEELLVGRGPGL